MEGVDKLLEDLERLTQPLPQREAFGARVFKVTKEDVRLTWVKVTGGELKVKAELSAREDARSPWSGKADQLRLYNGAKFQLVDTALPGDVVAVAGLSDAYPGRGWAANRTPARPLWSRCCGIGCCCPRASTCTRPWASCGSWSRRTRSFTWCGTSAWGRCTCS